MEIRTFLNEIKQKLLTWLVEWEIYHRIFPHLNRNSNEGYPFQTDEELFTACIHGDLDMIYRLKILEKQADQMGEAYGRAFRFIVYRDLNRRMDAYLRHAQQQLPARLREPAFV